MSFDEVLQRVEQRITDFQHSDEIVLSREALVEATELWQAAQPADPARPKRRENRRLAAARLALGWLHFLRYTALPAGQDGPDLARSVVFLSPSSANLKAIPEPLHIVLGPSADVRTQTVVANRMLEDAEVFPDSVLLEACIVLHTEALAATPSAHTDRPAMLSDLGLAYQRKFKRDGVATDMDRGVEFGEQAVATTPANHPDRLSIIFALSTTYHERFMRSEAAGDLDRAIELGEQAIAGTYSAPSDLAGDWSNLGVAYRRRFERTRVDADLDRAVELGEQAVAATPSSHFDRPKILSHLGASYLERFLHRGVQRDLNRAIELNEQAIAEAPLDGAWVGNVSELSRAYRAKFEHAGGAAVDLDRAVELGEQALAATPSNDRNRETRLANLGNAYLMRFEHTGVMADLDRAVQVSEEAAAPKSSDHRDRPEMLSDLANVYLRRFERTGVTADLDRAVELGEQAVAARPPNYPTRAKTLSHLGIRYVRRFEVDGVATDLDRGIDLIEQAVSATPIEDRDRGGRLSSLGIAYLRRFQHAGGAADLDRAANFGEQAVTATPPEHPNHAGYLFNLSLAYQAQLDAGIQSVDRNTLSALAMQANAAATASPVVRVKIKWAVGVLAHTMNEHVLAVELLDSAVTSMQMVAPRESGWEDQEHRLGGNTGVVGEAIAAHCAIDDPIGAIEIGELGRSVLLATQMNSRTDLSDLDRAHPDLAARLRQVRNLLNTPYASEAAPGESPTVLAGIIDARKRWWVEHDEVVTQIRRRRGFDRFLRPPRLVDLQPAANGGTVIMVNTGQQRSDAIILDTHATSPVSVPLTDLAATDVEHYAHALLKVSHDPSFAGILQRQRVIPEILAWLWDCIVHPVLQATSFSEGGQTLPHVWWSPTGLLGLFPLHAAGHPGKCGALDTVISSYAPTLRALAHARTRPSASTRRQLTVALSETPGLPDLPGTVVEAATLHNHHPDFPMLLDDNATIDRVLATLPAATWAHFACHADIDFAAPSRSGLRLHDGVLSMPQISSLQLERAELAYLSACSTAIRGFRHADESLHPAAAFHLAGFRHVLASLWPLADDIAASAATAFYQYLSPLSNADHAAAALHRTICDLRADHPSRPDLWAALIHSGP
ncbi:CHAT domain-containing protein [Nocardia gipuzkoensis]